MKTHCQLPQACWYTAIDIGWDVYIKGNQPWIFIGKTDPEAETPVLWPPDTKSQFIGKDPDAGEDWGQEEKRETEWDGWMVSPTQWTWVEQTLGDGEGQGNLCAIVHGVTKSWTWPNDWTTTTENITLSHRKSGFKYCLCYLNCIIMIEMNNPSEFILSLNRN